jgi:hypothetical protein
MNTHTFKAALAAAVAAAVIAIATASPHAYASYASWASPSATVYVNPANGDGLSDSGVISALQAAMDDWNIQGGSPFRFNYGGQVRDTTTGYDGKNVVLFRNENNGGTIAYTYSWWDASNHLLDSDMIIYDPGYTFYAYDGTCDVYAGYGVYLHDLTTHEFGHMLGLLHSSDPSATMYAGYANCATTQRSIEADDIAGIQALYGRSSSSSPAPTAPSNTAPSVSISSPGNNASFAEGTSITFSGSASDTQDGNLTAGLRWTSNIDGAIGNGGSFSRTLSAGTHTITASVTDSGGMSNAGSRTVTVVAPAPSGAGTGGTGGTGGTTGGTGGTGNTSGATLSARGYKSKGVQKADLSWSGLASGQTDVYRNNVLVTTTGNGGSYTDNIGKRGSGTYTYVVCDAGTSSCSNSVIVSF